MAPSTLNRVVVLVDGSEESTNGLRWALQNLRLSKQGSFVVLHVQPTPSVAAGLDPGSIPFDGISNIEVPAHTEGTEAYQKTSEAIIRHALQICEEKNVKATPKVVLGDHQETNCEVATKLKADLFVLGCRADGPIKRPSNVSLLVWVTFTHIPSVLNTLIGLEWLACHIGNLICFDANTEARKSLVYARALIEICHTNPWPSNLKVGIAEGLVMTVDVHYKWKPDICTSCQSFGHTLDTCLAGPVPAFQSETDVGLDKEN